MKQILVLGAGQSTKFLIHRLLERAQDRDWFVTVGDLNVATAQKAVAGHPRGAGIRFDVNDANLRSSHIEMADVVVNMLSPNFQDLVAWDCVNHNRHMLSASYRDQAVRDLDRDAHRAGILLLCEVGLDPGIDMMSAMSVIDRVRGQGGRILAFRSYGSGIPEEPPELNPWRYAITWNPRNVVMSGELGAQYMEDGKIRLVPFHHVFNHTWPVEVPGVGELEAYPNRDSMAYMRSFNLPHVRTMVRGTLRYPGWGETWSQIVRLGLPNEDLHIPDLGNRTYREVIEMFLPLNDGQQRIEERLARFLNINPTGRIVSNLSWLGLFSDEIIGCEGETPADMLKHLLQKRLPLESGTRDLIILLHQMDVEYPGRNDRVERISSSLVARGLGDGFTAMARTVGLPLALSTELLLSGEISLTGAQIPTHPSVYGPVLDGLAREGLEFEENTQTIS